MKAKVYVKFPKAGLGNKMLTWSRAYVFSQLNGLEMHTSSWFSFFIGAWLRKENKNRIYLGYFKSAGIYKTLQFFLYRVFLKKVNEPEVEKISITNDTLFVFDKIYRTYDFYKEVRPYKTLVRQGLMEMLTAKVKEAYDKADKPVIAIHVRRGDFKISNPITPISFFVEVINEIRKNSAASLPVTVFTDGDREEMEEILSLPDVKLAKESSDIIDILLLADSRYLVTSISSTFSYWGAFLSKGIIIKPAEEWQASFREETDPLAEKEIKWAGLPVSASIVAALKSQALN